MGEGRDRWRWDAPQDESRRARKYSAGIGRRFATRVVRLFVSQVVADRAQTVDEEEGC